MSDRKNPAPQEGTTHPAELPARETPVGAAPSQKEVREKCAQQCDDEASIEGIAQRCATKIRSMK